MPIKKSAIKALSVSERRTAENRRYKKRVNEAVKAVVAAPAPEKAASLSKAQAIIDKAVKRNVFHRNKGAHLKSRLAKVASDKA